MTNIEQYPRTRITYEDDTVIVFDNDGNIYYSGIEDYEPLKREPWVWNPENRTYTFGQYTKICIGEE